MKRFTLVSMLLAALAIGFFVGCAKDEPTTGNIGGDDRTVTSIELRLQQSQINGLRGESRTQQITAIAKNSRYVGVSGVKVQFAIRDPQTYKGSIAVAAVDSVTNENGQMIGTYSVVLDQSCTVEIEARVGQVFTTAVLTITVRESVGILSLEAARNVLTVPPGQTRSTTVSAVLMDSTGLALPGVEVQFRTRPAIRGIIDSDTGTTNNSGRVTRTFTSVVDQTGVCDVIARVGNTEATTSIEIREVAGPSAVGIRSDTPNLKVAEGQTATANIEATVIDQNRRGVSGATVEFRLEPLEGQERTFGSLSAPDTTDINGCVTAAFNSRGEFGSEYIYVLVLPSQSQESAPGNLPENTRRTVQLKSGGKVITEASEDLIEAFMQITVEKLGDVVRSMTVSATPAQMQLPPDSTGRAVIRATIRDNNRNGISNMRVDFHSTLGTLANPTLTDSFGVATADFFIRPRQDLDNLDDAQVVVVTATVPGTGWTRTVEINIEPTRSDRGSISISADPRFIYADNGLTTSTVTAILKDEDNQSLAGREIIFTSTDPGAINSPVVTDSLGRAIAVFTDHGVPSVPDSVLVTARYVPMGISASVNIMIGERNPVANIVLRSASQQMIAGRGDSTVVRATCFLANDQPAPNGTQVHFEARLGSFTSVVSAVQGDFGAAESYYIAGRLTGTDTLQAWVDNGTERIYSNVVLIDLVSGPPNQLLLSTSHQQLTTNDPAAFAMITATVLDTAGNRVRQGFMIAFTTNLGTIQPSAVTDENGQAVTRLTPGTISGTALITASYTPVGGNPISAQITVEFLAGVPNSIELSADPLHIQVIGAGMRTYSTISATVKDANGNNITVPTTVVFELLNEPPPPAGCNINDRGQRDSSQTANGVAVVTLNAGEQIGGKLIRAYSWKDSLRTDTVSTINSNVAVVAGPPFQLDIDVNDDGEDAGGGAWVVEVSARVWDIHRNPVADRIPVVFTVDPEIANIDPGYTGNEGRAGVPVSGLAYADMVYNSVNTFDPIQISAEVQTRLGIIAGTREHVLALQEGNLDLHVDPGNWMFQEGSEDAVIRCWVVLKDGHEILINNAPILFTSNRGRFYWFNFRRNRYEMFFPDPTRKFTGVVDIEHNEEPGQATVYLCVIEPDIFLDPFTLEVTVQINANVEGYNDVAADPAFIFFTRHGRE